MNREADSVVVKMSVLFNKDAYESALPALSTTAEVSANDAAEAASEPVRRALRDVLVTGKIGALSVNPEYLVVEPLESE